MENIADLLQEKENEFMEQFVNMDLESLYWELSMDTDSYRISDFQKLYDNLKQQFAHYLLIDDDFLDTNIISHFYEGHGVHIFGIDLLSVYQPCKCCGDVTTEWIALVVDTKSNIVTLNLCRECLDSDSVQDSHFRGKPLKSVFPLIDYDYSAQII